MKIRIILILLLLLGLTTIALSLLQTAEDISRWSKGYALFETLGDRNPLNSDEIRREYRDLFYARTSTKYIFWIGVLTTAFSTVGIFISFRTHQKAIEA